MAGHDGYDYPNRLKLPSMVETGMQPDGWLVMAVSTHYHGWLITVAVILIYHLFFGNHLPSSASEAVGSNPLMVDRCEPLIKGSQLHCTKDQPAEPLINLVITQPHQYQLVPLWLITQCHHSHGGFSK